MGCIYIIKNKVNDKVYIGQTINTIEERFKQHLRCAYNNSIKTKLYVNMRQIGIDKFYVEQVVNCDNKDLNKLEQYYVEKYDSIDNGYNTVFPCTTYSGDKHVHDYDERVIEMYMDGMSSSIIAQQINISLNHIYSILNKYNIEKRGEPTTIVDNNGKRCVIMCDLNFKHIIKFESIKEAYQWICENTDYNKSSWGFYTCVRLACENGNIAYGHRWQLFEDLIYKNKVFRTRFDREQYIENGESGEHILTDNDYYIVDGALDRVKTWHGTTEEKIHRCIDCGKVIGRKSTRCLECAAKVQRLDYEGEYECKQCKRKVTILIDGLCASCYNVKMKGKIPKPSKEQLLLEFKQYSNKEIAEKYGRSTSTIVSWKRGCDLDVGEERKLKQNGYIDKTSNEQLMEDFKKYTIKEIAKKYNRSTSMVSYWKEQCGLVSKNNEN